MPRDLPARPAPPDSRSARWSGPGELRAGGQLDGHEISSLQVVPYGYPFTYDVLPGSKTGMFFAGGALVGSTLRGYAP
ncbi:MAG TPA: hypothetical protein VLT58_02740 [Polyangia bacterium]|nr:hypothetical protein [Polyangia bacterium]